MIKWQYHCEEARVSITRQTNELGANGWELVTSYPWNKDIILVFKREAPVEPVSIDDAKHHCCIYR